MSAIDENAAIQESKQMSRVIFYLLHLIFLVSVGISIIPDVSVDAANYLFFVGFVSAASIMLVRCKKCQTYLVRKGKEGFGAPEYDYFIQSKRCPKCGLERI